MEKKVATYILSIKMLDLLHKASCTLGISKSHLIEQAVESYIKFVLKDKLMSDMDELTKDLTKEEVE